MRLWFTFGGKNQLLACRGVENRDFLPHYNFYQVFSTLANSSVFFLLSIAHSQIFTQFKLLVWILS